MGGPEWWGDGAVDCWNQVARTGKLGADAAFWQKYFGQKNGRGDPSTAVVTKGQTVYAGGGNRYQTDIAPDGSFSVCTYSNGRLTSTTAYNSAGGQVTRATYAYDPHGRQSSLTDARNGATTYDPQGRIGGSDNICALPYLG
jgi:YD repeat-containing protein